MHKLALKAVAKLANIDIRSAAKANRHNPILDSEIDISEELINLQESLDTYHAAGDTLKSYPTMRVYFLRERREILRHCIGLIERMLRGYKLPYSYTTADADRAIRQLIRLMIKETRRSGQRVDGDIMDILRPFMTVRQRVQTGDRGLDLVMQASQLPKVYSMGSAVVRRARLQLQP